MYSQLNTCTCTVNRTHVHVQSTEHMYMYSQPNTHSNPTFEKFELMQALENVRAAQGGEVCSNVVTF